MKKYGILSVLFSIFIIVTGPAAAFAAESEITADPGITPDSPFYFIKNWMQQLNLAFTFREENRAQKALGFAEEQLAEMAAMSQRNQIEAMERSAGEYRNSLTVVTQNMERTIARGTEISQQVAERLSAHISYTFKNPGSQNENSASLMLQVRERAEICQESAIMGLAAKDSENALRLNLNLMQQECSRINNGTAPAEEALQQYERLRTMNREIIALAVKEGKGNQAQSTADQQIANMERVMAEVRNQVQNRNQNTTGSASQNTANNQPENAGPSQSPSQGQNAGPSQGSTSQASSGSSAGSSSPGGTVSNGGGPGGGSGQGGKN